MSKNIVICGSMKLKDEMLLTGKTLEEKGYKVLYPVECMEGKPKVIASKAHFNRIVDKANDTILIVNGTKNGIENYIGPNSFAEIAMAFYYEKRVVLLNDIYPPYKDELEGWNVETLKGNIDNL